MTKIISVFILIVVIFCGYQLWLKWDAVQHEEETKKKEEASLMNPANLPGSTWQLDQSYQNAAKNGNNAIREWLKTYGSSIQDPKKAWLELDYCVAITRENPGEARRVFKEVKDRTPANSPIQPRLKQMEKTYE